MHIFKTECQYSVASRTTITIGGDSEIIPSPVRVSESHETFDIDSATLFTYPQLYVELIEMTPSPQMPM